MFSQQCVVSRVKQATSWEDETEMGERGGGGTYAVNGGGHLVQLVGADVGAEGEPKVQQRPLAQQIPAGKDGSVWLPARPPSMPGPTTCEFDRLAKSNTSTTPDVVC